MSQDWREPEVTALAPLSFPGSPRTWPNRHTQQASQDGYGFGEKLNGENVSSCATCLGFGGGYKFPRAL